jgi:uncharacterized membrane protein
MRFLDLGALCKVNKAQQQTKFTKKVKIHFKLFIFLNWSELTSIWANFLSFIEMVE